MLAGSASVKVLNCAPIYFDHRPVLGHLPALSLWQTGVAQATVQAEGLQLQGISDAQWTTYVTAASVHLQQWHNAQNVASLDDTANTLVDDCMTLAQDTFGTLKPADDPCDHIYWSLTRSLDLCHCLWQLEHDRASKCPVTLGHVTTWLQQVAVERVDKLR